MIEVTELRKKPLAEKLNLTSTAFELGKLLNLPFKKKDADAKTVRERWRLLKNFPHGKDAHHDGDKAETRNQRGGSKGHPRNSGGLINSD